MQKNQKLEELHHLENLHALGLIDDVVFGAEKRRLFREVKP